MQQGKKLSEYDFQWNMLIVTSKPFLGGAHALRDYSKNGGSQWNSADNSLKEISVILHCYVPFY